MYPLQIGFQSSFWRTSRRCIGRCKNAIELPPRSQNDCYFNRVPEKGKDPVPHAKQGIGDPCIGPRCRIRNNRAVRALEQPAGRGQCQIKRALFCLETNWIISRAEGAKNLTSRKRPLCKPAAAAAALNFPSPIFQSTPSPTYCLSDELNWD